MRVKLSVMALFLVCLLAFSIPFANEASEVTGQPLSALESRGLATIR